MSPLEPNKDVKSFRSVVAAQPPLEEQLPQQGAPSRSAAGLPAVLKTAEVSMAEMGIVRGARALLKVNQKDGFDCQSCAWPNPDEHRQMFEFCENGAKAVADEATTARIGPDFFQKYSIQELSQQTDHWLGKQGRLTSPMFLKAGGSHYESITWDSAFELVGRELNTLKSPDEAAFYTSGRTSNEAAFLYQLFVRQWGTNNLPDCSNMCHESSGVALKETLGIGKGSVTLDDFDHAEVVLVIGQNPGTNHPRMLTALQRARERGCRVVTINPLEEVGMVRFKNPQNLMNPLLAPGVLFGKGFGLSDLHIPVRINGDMALFQGIMKEMLDRESRAPGTILDWDFIRKHTDGFEALERHLKALDWRDLVNQSGIPREMIFQVVDWVVNAKSIIACWAMGLTQHRNAVGTIQEVVNFLLLRGNVGRPGAGVCPVRGHSNVQGDRTMGIYEKMPEEFLSRLGDEFGFLAPRKHGLDTVETIQAMMKGAVKVFIAMGGNFLSAAPDTEFTAAALAKCSLTVQVSTKLNRSHLVTGQQALILPCLGRTEVDRQASGAQFVTVEDSMGVISSSRGFLEPASPDLLSEPLIVAGLAQATLGGKSKADWRGMTENYDRIRERIEKVLPGFEDFNRRIRKGPFYLPHAVRDHRSFSTRSGKACFTVHPLQPIQVPVGAYLLMTIRTHDQFNTTIYGLDDRYRGIYNGRRVVFMNPHDMKREKWVQGQWMDLVNRDGGVERVGKKFMLAPYDIPEGCVAAYFPEANVLVPVQHTAEGSNTPVSKSVVVYLSPSKE